MTTITLSISVSSAPLVEGGATSPFIIILDSPAPAGGLLVNFNTTGSTATFGRDYVLIAGTNITQLGANSFIIAAGATSALLDVSAATDAVLDPNDTVSIQLTAGVGYMSGATDFAAGSYPQDVIANDFNKDGNIDLAIAGFSHVSVLLGNGDGSFAGLIAANQFGSGSLANGITVGDFNVDGNPDLATSNSMLKFLTLDFREVH